MKRKINCGESLLKEEKVHIENLLEMLIMKFQILYNIKVYLQKKWAAKSNDWLLKLDIVNEEFLKENINSF